MPSSTSSFEHFDCAARRAPDVPWARVFLLVSVLSVLGLVAMEMTWAHFGLYTSLVNDEPLWQYELDRMRRAATSQGGYDDSLMLIGSSRIQNGVDPAILEQRLGVEVYNLSISGTSSLDLIEYIADDTDYDGLVVVEFWPLHHLIQDMKDGSKARRYTEYEQNAAFISPIEFQLDRVLHENFRIFHPGLNSIELFFHALYKREIRYPADNYSINRYGPLDYDRQSQAWLKSNIKKYADRAASRTAISPGEEFAARKALFIKPIEKIQARGGKVVFVHTSLSGAVRDTENEKFPRDVYWTPFMDGLGDGALHYLDDPVMSQLDCADGAHLEASLASKQSEAIADYLKEFLK